MSIEGIALEHFNATYQETSSLTFHSCKRMSDNSKQDAAKTAAHSKRIIYLLKNIKCLGAGHSTMWDNIDGCTYHYRFTTEVYFWYRFTITWHRGCRWTERYGKKVHLPYDGHFITPW